MFTSYIKVSRPQKTKTEARKIKKVGYQMRNIKFPNDPIARCPYARKLAKK